MAWAEDEHAAWAEAGVGAGAGAGAEAEAEASPPAVRRPLRNVQRRTQVMTRTLVMHPASPKVMTTPAASTPMKSPTSTRFAATPRSSRR